MKVSIYILTYKFFKNGVLISVERVEREKKSGFESSSSFLFSSVTAKCNDGTFS